MSTPDVMTEVELLNHIGDLVSQHIAASKHDNVEHLTEKNDAIERLTKENEQYRGEVGRMLSQLSHLNAQYNNLVSVVMQLAHHYHVRNEADVLHAVEQLVTSAKRAGHDEGFLFGLKSALDIVVKFGNPASASIQNVIEDFEANREKY